MSDTTGTTQPVSALVTSVARRLGVDLSTVRGTGAGGRVSVADIHNAASRPGSRASRPVASQQPEDADDGWFPGLVAAERLRAHKQAVRNGRPDSVAPVVPGTPEADLAHPLLQGPIAPRPSAC